MLSDRVLTYKIIGDEVVISNLKSAERREIFQCTLDAVRVGDGMVLPKYQANVRTLGPRMFYRLDNMLSAKSYHRRVYLYSLKLILFGDALELPIYNTTRFAQLRYSECLRRGRISCTNDPMPRKINNAPNPYTLQRKHIRELDSYFIRAPYQYLRGCAPEKYGRRRFRYVPNLHDQGYPGE